jgi:hypothetical protein
MPSARSSYNMRGITGVSGTLERDFAIIKANLNREINNIKNRTNKGLILACIEVRESMENIPPLIPLKYGNLRASWFITTKKNADPVSKSLQVRTAKFRKAHTPEILAKLKEGHTAMLAEADSIMSAYPIGVMMGFSAFYSAPVHEMMDDKFAEPVNWSKSASGPKFFQAALYRNFDRIIAIVKSNAHVKP